MSIDDTIARLRGLASGEPSHLSDSDRDDIIDALPALLDEVERLRSRIWTMTAEAEDHASDLLALREVAQRAADRECEARAEVARLRAGGCARGQTTTQWCAEAARYARERDEAHAAGVAKERARVVAWLRAGLRQLPQAQAVLADRIERGDHEPGTAPAGGPDE